jgi:hypothetical protein
MGQRMPGRRNPAATVILAAGLVLAALAAAGCSGQPETPRASVESCIQFGVAAIRHHVTATSLPPACRGLTRAQVNFAVGSALHSVAIGAGGKVRQRERIAQVSHFLEHLAAAVPPQRSEPQLPPPAVRSASRATLGLIALGAWLITVALGLWMMTRWILRSRARHRPAGRLRRPPALNLAHLGLAGTSLLTWIAYLVTGMIGLAWTACALLPLVTGLGMTLVFLPSSASPAHSATAQPSPIARASDPARGDSPGGPRRPAFTVGAHIVFATATILFAVLTVIGTG